MDHIERFSWWGTYQNNKEERAKTDNALLVDASGNLTPVGNAIVNYCDATLVDC